MDEKVISFREARIRRAVQRREYDRRVSSLRCSAYQHSVNCSEKKSYPSETEIEFNKEYTELIDALSSRHRKYRYPTILSGYRKEINPVDALYQNLQESLFKYNPENEFCVWVINLFKDEVWLSQLLQDLEDDCNSITDFQQRHYKNPNNIGLNKLHILQNIKSNFEHYAELFTMMQSWEE
jgi:hypothetical protein